MDINNRINTLQSFIDLVEGRVESTDLSSCPSTKIRISNIEGFGLYSNELFSIIDIKRAIDDQMYWIAKYITGKSSRQDNNIYFALHEGSIEVEALFECIKELVKNPQFGKRGTIFLLAISIVWMSPDFLKSYVELHNKNLSTDTEIELKRLDLENEEIKRQHELEMKALDLISKDEELKMVASRSFDTYAKILRSVRRGSSVEINGLSIDREQMDNYLMLTNAYDEWVAHIDGRFVVLKGKKKEKERYIFTLQKVETHKKYDVTVNMELYDPVLLRLLHDASRKGSTLYARIVFIRKDKVIERVEFSEINNKKMSEYKIKNLTRKSSGRKKPRR